MQQLSPFDNHLISVCNTKLSKTSSFSLHSFSNRRLCKACLFILLTALITKFKSHLNDRSFFFATKYWRFILQWIVNILGFKSLKYVINPRHFPISLSIFIIIYFPVAIPIKCFEGYEVVRGISFIDMTYVVVKWEKIRIKTCNSLKNGRPKYLFFFLYFR